MVVVAAEPVLGAVSWDVVVVVVVAAVVQRQLAVSWGVVVVVVAVSSDAQQVQVQPGPLSEEAPRAAKVRVRACVKRAWDEWEGLLV